MNGAVTIASDMAEPGWRIRLVQPQAKVHARKGGVGPEDIHPVSRHPAMRSIEVEQDVLPERRKKHDGGFEKGRSQDEREHEHEHEHEHERRFACFRKSKSSSNTAFSCVPTVAGRSNGI